MDGSTLLELRTHLRRILNEPSPGFWTNADLNAYIKKACDKYYSIYQSKVPEFGRIEYDITYPASSENYDISESDWCFREALMLEDRTNGTPGIQIPIVNSIDKVLRANSDISTDTYFGTPQIAYVEHTQDISSGVVSNTLTIWLSPVPASSRTLRLHIRAVPADISTSDTNTTGLPVIFDNAIVLQAAAFARLQEQNSEVGMLMQELERAEEFVSNQIKPYAREASRVVFESDD